MFPSRAENAKFKEFVKGRRSLMECLVSRHEKEGKLVLDELGRKLLGLESWF
jgi:hypothetical protein